ncbi:MAG TPA: MFS transporter [Candidatus Binatia bacterium]|nr:MFS transporter [Candidatus Binatia bacterium]
MARRALRAGERAALRRVVGAYFAYQTFGSVNFFWPVFVVFYQRYGRLDLPAIFELQAFFTLSRVVLDVPLGLAADRFGRRLALIASAALTAIGCGVIVAWPSLVAFYLAELCFASSVAAKSGADSALLYDALSEHGQVDDYPRVEGRAQSLAALAAATSAIASGLLLEWWLPLPYLMTLSAACATVMSAVLIDEPVRVTSSASWRGIARGALREIVASRAAMWVIALYALLVVLSHVVFYLQQPYLEAIGVPVALFGVVFAASKLVHAMAASRAARVEALVPPARMPAVLLAAALSPIALMGAIASPLGALVVPLRGVADGLLQPVVNFYLNRLVSPFRRASVLSIASFAARLLQVVVLWAFGMALARMSASATLRLAAVLGALASAALLWLPHGGRAPAAARPAPVGDRGRATLDGARDDPAARD